MSSVARFVTVPAAIIIAAILSVSSPALAQEAEPDLGAKLTLAVSAHKTTAALGDTVELTVTLGTTSDTAVDVVEAVFDSKSISLELAPEGLKDERGQARKFYYLRFHRGFFDQKRWATIKLEKGSPKTVKIPIVMTRVGKVDVSALFAGYPRGRGSEPKKSEAVTIDVTPREGKSDLCVRIETSHGTIVGKLNPEVAMGTVMNFTRLVSDGFYDGLGFHRIIGPTKMPPDGFMIQGGCPKGDGTGGPGYTIPAEFSKEKHVPGVFSMARTGRGPHTAGCQFFVCVGSPGHLDGQYTVFGATIEGLDVVKKIGDLPTGARDKPNEAVKIVKATLEYR